MATKTSLPSLSSVKNQRIIWFYQSNSNTDEQAEWRRYSDFESDFIEEAFQKKEDEEITFDDYIINLKDNIQFNKNDDNQRSHVKRAEISTNDPARKERFSYSEPIQIKSFEINYSSNIINKWLRKNQNIKNNYTAIAELAAQGILEEGKSLNKNLDAEKMAKKLRICVLENSNIKTHYLDMAVKKCVAHLYSVESFLYKLVNSTLRDNDLSKIDTQGPFCYLLSKYLPFQRPGGPLGYTVYRGIKLSMEMIEKYTAAVNKRIVWPAFTSTTKDRQVAEFYSDNALFIIEVTAVHSQGVRDISSLSNFPDEREVLFCAGQSFTISKFEYDLKSEKYLIYMFS